MGPGLDRLGLRVHPGGWRAAAPGAHHQQVREPCERHSPAVDRLHDLRHTSATIALAAGVRPKVVQERLGHADISIALDLYSHVTPGMGVEAAAKIGAALYGAST